MINKNIKDRQETILPAVNYSSLTVVSNNGV